MIHVKQYANDSKQEWDALVKSSKNGTFLFFRDFMEYHSDRFSDCSLLFYVDSICVALLPANRVESTFISHGGLTYGGFIVSPRMTTVLMLKLFDELVGYLKKNGIARCIYKAIPHMYHRFSSEEDLYALFRHGAKILRRDCSSAILINEKRSITHGKVWRAQKHFSKVTCQQSDLWEEFMQIVAKGLQKKYGATPTHSAKEMKMLASRFPQQILLYGAFADNELIGGMILFKTEMVAHAQYIASTEQGRKYGSTQILLDFILKELFCDIKYFDFGISTEREGRYLNEGLSNFKEESGGSAIVYDTYELSVRYDC